MEMHKHYCDFCGEYISDCTCNPGDEWCDFPICPHCHEPDHDWWDGLQVTIVDGTEFVSTCINCNKLYKVECFVTTTFRTKDATK